MPKTVKSTVVYTTQELGDILKLSVSMVNRLAREGKIRPVAGIRSRRYTQAEVDRFLAKRRSDAKP